jgi:tetratricopeptide (TPR) repeat protein
MDVRTWTTISRLLDDALDVPPEARDAWLSRLPPEHAPLVPQLRALLDQMQGLDAAAFLATLPKFETAEPAEPAEGPGAGGLVGPYRLLRVLASGGQGSVWLAERADGVLARPVALKLPHGLAHRAGLAERMARERDILAGLSHPHIARLYDAGVTAAGEPYLALEFVDGQPIDRFADAHALPVADRVRLFLQVVRAVAYAHGRLVIHRDLKPANILVTADGGARLLDFGIAKLLGADGPIDSTLTVESGRALSLPYASPEQVAQQPLGVATDVYSLGVVLFELLAGVRPYVLPHPSAAALEAAILAGEVRRASALAPLPERRKALAGELDTILAKALRREPEARYASAEALADDLDRWLDGRPVLAEPASRAYRLRMFIGRHQVGVAAATAATLAVLAGAGAAIWQARVAGLERDAAIREETRARASSGFLQALLQQATPDRPLTATELLDRGTAQLDASDMDEDVLAYLRYEISTHYLRFNQTDRELALLAKSADGARRAGDLDLAASAECAAGWSMAYRDLPAARLRIAEGERLLAGIGRPTLRAQSDCLRAAARVLEGDGQFEAAIALMENRLPTLPPATATTWTRRSLLRTQLSDLYTRVGRIKDAYRVNTDGLAEVRQRGQAGTLNEFTAINNIAGNLNRMGEVVEAAGLYRELLTWLDRGVFAVPPVAARSNVGFAELQLGNAAEALRLADLELATDQAAGNPLQAALADLLAARALLRLGQTEASTRRVDAAERFFLTNPRPFARMLTETTMHRAELQRAAGDGEAAGRTVDALLARLDYPAKKSAGSLDRVLRLSARLRLDDDDAVTALSRAGDALEVASGVARDPRRSADVGDAALLRARAHLALGHEADARRDLELARAALSAGLGPDHALTAEAAALAARLGPAQASVP